jgi:hypothetical protein
MSCKTGNFYFLEIRPNYLKHWLDVVAFCSRNTPFKSWSLPVVLTFFMVVLSWFRFVWDILPQNQDRCDMCHL